MNLNWLCKIGIHDYYLLDLKDTPEIEEEIRARILNTFPMSIISIGYPYYRKMICKRCHKIVDEITKYLPIAEKKVRKELELEKLGGKR